MTITQEDRNLLKEIFDLTDDQLDEYGDDDPDLAILARHREAAFLAGARAMQERALNEAQLFWTYDDVRNVTKSACRHLSERIRAIDPASLQEEGARRRSFDEAHYKAVSEGVEVWMPNRTGGKDDG